MLHRNLYLGKLIWLFNDTLYNESYTSGNNLYGVFKNFDKLLSEYETNANFEFPNGTVWNFWNALLYAGTIYTTIGAP